jgi:cobalt/nickel transport system permease protein
VNKKEKRIVTLAVAFALFFGVAPAANAMHIMEGYLPQQFCIIWGVICIPFLVVGYLSIKKTLSKQHKSIIILSMAGAFVFVLSSLKIPSVTGSCLRREFTFLCTDRYWSWCNCLLNGTVSREK